MCKEKYIFFSNYKYGDVLRFSIFLLLTMTCMNAFAHVMREGGESFSKIDVIIKFNVYK